jgi:prepilin-type processing-associated H-X9-DG protein
MLVVIAIIGILASLLLPALGRAKERTHLVRCQSNIRQIQLSWLLYAEDNSTRLPSCTTAGLGGSTIADKIALRPDSWVVGNMRNTDESTNITALLDAALGKYTQSEKFYHCPVDTSVNALGQRRVRSISMNMYMNASYTDGTPIGQVERAFKFFRRTSDLDDPSMRIVILEEKAELIEDGIFRHTMQGLACFQNVPALYHAGGTAITFADGHNEYHIWQDESIKLQTAHGVGLPSPNDVPWMSARITAPIN